MARALYNIRSLGDPSVRQARLAAFLDGFAAAIDIYPVCEPQRMRRGADALWEDFVRIASDMDRAVLQARRERPAGKASSASMPSEDLPSEGRVIASHG